jgi:4-hydroxybenzoate polyprenyltransferase
MNQTEFKIRVKNWGVEIVTLFIAVLYTSFALLLFLLFFPFSIIPAVLIVAILYGHFKKPPETP